MKRDVYKDSDVGSNQSGSEHDKLIERLLRDPHKREAVEWLKGAGIDDKRTIGACETNRDAMEFIQEIYSLGALEVFAVQIRPLPEGIGQRTGKLVVKLPRSSGLRQAIFDWCRKQGESVGFSPDPDRGESHLFLLLD